MNLVDEEGTSKPRGCRAKADKGNTRKTWTQRDEEVLVNALRTIVTTGWKCENGFHAGYLNQLEAIMCKQLPNIDIRAKPHINSKIHVWKKHYGTLMGMLGKSDFGWDDSRSMITVDSQDVWDEYCKMLLTLVVTLPTNVLVKSAKSFSWTTKEVEKRSAVFAAVGSIPGIDLNEQILISDRLVEHPKKMDLFFSLLDDARARMVGLMLSGKV
ncbi:UNVERIFIED_CONTAM: hypothetical protein Sangu_1181800 [Sesamum angustifolium]|uniref:Myb/SANT-like domain-containing protein n=1 Tax=Sesamum angustifolium TaxID=2727405 RepID=A0AAW2NH97_9LAMI